MPDADEAAPVPDGGDMVINVAVENLDKSERFAKNDSSLKAKDKDYLAQFIIKPNYNATAGINQSVTTGINNPSPLDVGNAEYIDNPVVANLSPRAMNQLGGSYNLAYEPYSSKYGKNIESDRLRGNRRSSEEKSNMDLKFEFAGPKRNSDERQYFKTI